MFCTSEASNLQLAEIWNTALRISSSTFDLKTLLIPKCWDTGARYQSHQARPTEVPLTCCHGSSVWWRSMTHPCTSPQPTSPSPPLCWTSRRSRAASPSIPSSWSSTTGDCATSLPQPRPRVSNRRKAWRLKRVNPSLLVLGHLLFPMTSCL